MWVDNESGRTMKAGAAVLVQRGTPDIVMVVGELCTVTTSLPLSFEAEASMTAPHSWEWITGWLLYLY